MIESLRYGGWGTLAPPKQQDSQTAADGCQPD